MSSQKLPLLTEIRRRFNLLDYGVESAGTDSMGRPFKYRTYPYVHGSTCYFQSKAELVRYLEQVEQTRRNYLY